MISLKVVRISEEEFDDNGKKPTVYSSSGKTVSPSNDPFSERREKNIALRKSMRKGYE